MSPRLVICADCGEERPHRAHGLCGRCYLRRRRLDPGNRERDRQASLRWKQQNRDRVRAYNQAHAMTGRCSECNGPMARNCDGGVCLPCRSRKKQERRERICAMWAEGLTVSMIARELGTSKSALGVEIAQMRADGWDVPHRRAPEQVARIRAGRLAAKASA